MPYFPATARYSLPYRAVVMREQRLALARGAKASDTKNVAAQANQHAALKAEDFDFGAQGGDPSRGVEMDLSTCVNRYSPAIRTIRPEYIWIQRN